MKIVQIAKKLNNTELGRGTTHDSYVLVPSDLDVTCIFDTPDTPIEFTDKASAKKITLRNTVDTEKRIVGLGPYYREKDLNAGDEIVFERRSIAGAEEYYLDTKKYSDNLVMQKYKYGFEILTPDRLDRFQRMISTKNPELTISFLQSQKKRADSPEATDFYDVSLSGRSLINEYDVKEIVEIQLRDDGIMISSFYGWKKYVFEIGEER